MKYFACIGFVVVTALITGCSHFPETSREKISAQVALTQQAHGLQSWWEKEIMKAKVVIEFGGKTAVEGVFIFEAHGPRARFERSDGAVVLFDGKTVRCGVHQPSSEDVAQI